MSFHLLTNLDINIFLATLVALHLTPVSKSVGHSLELASLLIFVLLAIWVSGISKIPVSQRKSVHICIEFERLTEANMMSATSQ